MIDDAINAYKKSIEIEPDNARVHYSLGTLCAMKGKYSDAADKFWMAVEINPKMSEPHEYIEKNTYHLCMIISLRGPICDCLGFAILQQGF